MNSTEPPKDQSNYSYKEMMEELRKQRKGEGGEVSGRQSQSSEAGSTSQPVRIEVVEAEDGTKHVAEVRRRRKRRSHQPKKVKEARVILMRRTLVFGGIPLMMLFVGGYMLMLSRIRGEGFRTGASERISEIVGTDVEFGRFQLSGLNLNSRKVVVAGTPGGLFREAEIGALRTRLNPVTMLSNAWSLGFVQASSGSLRFGLGGADRREPELGGKAADLGDRLQVVAAGIGLDSDPKNIDISGIKIAGCDLFWDGNAPAANPFIASSNASTGDLSEPIVGLSFRGGQLAVPGWPEFGIEAISGDLNKGVYQVRRASLLHVGDGNLSLKGTVATTGDGKYRFAGEYSDIELREIVHEEWADKLGGKVDGKIEVEGALTKVGSMNAEGEFSIRKLVFSNNKILQRLSLTVGESLLARLEFRTFQGRYRRGADRTEFYDLEGEHLALLRLRGGFSVFFDGRLEGSIEIGLPEQILAKAEGGKPALFGAERDGFCWTTVTLGGLIDDPREDLTTRLQQALRQFIKERDRTLPGTGIQTLPNKTPPAGGDVLENTFERLIEP
jgi:hypothetical protein